MCVCLCEYAQLCECSAWENSDREGREWEGHSHTIADIHSCTHLSLSVLDVADPSGD